MRSGWQRSGWLSVVAGALAVASLLGSGCGRSSSGETGRVEFELAVAHVEAVGVGAPVARGSTLLLRVTSEEFRSSALELAADGLDGNTVHLFPAGFGQFGLHVPEAGRVRLTASVAGEPVDALELEVAEPDSLTLSELALLETRVDECVTHATVRLGEVVLAPNQRLRLFVVPRSKGRALVGLLPLDASAQGAEVSALSQSDVVPAHALELALEDGAGVASMSQPVELRVRDTVNTLDVRRRITTRWTDAAPEACRKSTAP